MVKLSEWRTILRGYAAARRCGMVNGELLDAMLGIREQFVLVLGLRNYVYAMLDDRAAQRVTKFTIYDHSDHEIEIEPAHEQDTLAEYLSKQFNAHTLPMRVQDDERDMSL
jgi:hypothetical protein